MKTQGEPPGLENIQTRRVLTPSGYMALDGEGFYDERGRRIDMLMWADFARGELGVLGGHVPEWYEGHSHIEESGKGRDTCEVIRLRFVFRTKDGREWWSEEPNHASLRLHLP